jgi:hypothetical protein
MDWTAKAINHMVGEMSEEEAYLFLDALAKLTYICVSSWWRRHGMDETAQDLRGRPLTDEEWDDYCGALEYTMDEVRWEKWVNNMRVADEDNPAES